MAVKHPKTKFQSGKRELAARPSDSKGKSNKRVTMIRSVIREVAGFKPYERRMMELLKIGKDKRALKLAKKRLGSITRGKKKRSDMERVLREQRAKRHHEA